MTAPCPRFGKWIGGCRFEARYDVGAPTLKGDDLFWMPSRQMLQAIEASRPTTYRGETCTTCGKVIDATIIVQSTSEEE